MKNNKRADYLNRDRALELLSDDEVAKVSNQEATNQLTDGDEYLDLEHLSLGVRRADGVSATMSSVLPRKAVREETWSRLMALIGPTPQRNGAP